MPTIQRKKRTLRVSGRRFDRAPAARPQPVRARGGRDRAPGPTAGGLRVGGGRARRGPSVAAPVRTGAGRQKRVKRFHQRASPIPNAPSDCNGASIANAPRHRKRDRSGRLLSRARAARPARAARWRRRRGSRRRSRCSSRPAAIVSLGEDERVAADRQRRHHDDDRERHAGQPEHAAREREHRERMDDAASAATATSRRASAPRTP